MTKKIQILRKEKDKNISLTRKNQQLIKMLRNLSYILSTDDFFLKNVDTEKFRISGKRF
jgi:hypothetical protein